MKLREYQTDDLIAIQTAYRKHYRRVLFRGATGSGKTVMFSRMATESLALGKRTLIIVHRKELLDQCSKALVFTPHGKIAPGEPRTDHSIQIATIQSLVRRDYADKYDFIVIDEAHHATAATYLKVIEANPRAHVLGVTATPCRMAGYGLGDLFQILIEQSLSIKELTMQGWLSRVKVFSPSVIDVDGVSTQAGDFRRSQLEEAVFKSEITGDYIEHYRKYAWGLPAIAFCVSVRHSERVSERFNMAGIPSESISGLTPTNRRRNSLDALEHGQIKILCTCDLANEGLDIPVVVCGIMLRPSESLALVLQQMGRILRPSPGKKEAIILDHAGNCLRHGLPDQDREWTLDKTVKHGVRTDDEPAVNVRQCPKCFFVHEFKNSCPECKYVYQPEDRVVTEKEGKLELLRAQNIEKNDKRVEVRRARSREALEAIAKKRGYKSGWVHWMMKSRGVS